jgi:hypothetical protein
MEELAGTASLRDAGTTTGIATGKLLALIAQTPPSVGVVIMPCETDREERRAIDAKLVASPATPAQQFRSRYPRAVKPGLTNPLSAVRACAYSPWREVQDGKKICKNSRSKGIPGERRRAWACDLPVRYRVC